MNGSRLTFVLAALLATGVCAAASRYVDQGSPAAQDAGDGEFIRPYRTLAYAMKQLKAGDTLNIAGGVYRDALLFPEIAWSGGSTVIQAVDTREVLIKGSDVVTGWEPAERGLYVKRPWTVNSEQVFVDGRALIQLGGTILGGYPGKPDHPMAKLHAAQGGIWPGRVSGGTHDMVDYNFYYDAGAQSLYIRVPFSSLDGHSVEVSVRPYLVLGKSLQDVTLKNLHFQHANTTAVSQSGAVSLGGKRIVLDGVEISYVDGNGLDLSGDENMVKASRANYCGQVGMKVRGRANRLIGNETNYNNTRGFNKWWEAGGAKFVGDGGLRDSEVSGHRALGNSGDGLWFDWMNSNNRIHDNVSAYNTGFGIHYEASQQGYIYNNYVFGNGQRGIYLPHSSASVVAYNLIAKNGMEGIAIIDEGRSKDKPELRPRGDRVVGNILAWNGKAALVLPAGPLESVSDYNLVLGSREPPTFSVGWGSRESPIRRGLAEWTAASGQDAHSWSESLDIPVTLLDAIEKKQPNPDWTQVTALASRFSVQAAGVLSGISTAVATNQSSPGPGR
jgi:parallel beta-helix repeat protein